MPMTDLDTDLFREAMASFPSDVTTVTTTDKRGRRWRFAPDTWISRTRAQQEIGTSARVPVLTARPSIVGVAIGGGTDDSDEPG
jgi:hypothetical protein